MKKILILSIFFFSFIFGQGNRENSTNIVMRDGLLYRLDSYFRIGFDIGLTPYSGLVFTVIESKYNYGSYVKREYNVLNGIRNGNYKTWLESGDICVDKNYLNGILHGPYRNCFENSGSKKGHHITETIYKDGKEDGPYKEYYENGELISEGTYKDGKKDGKWTEYKWGELISEGTYKDGKKDGKWTEYKNRFSETRLFETTYKDGQKHGLYKLYFKNGQLEEEGNYKNGQKHGQWIEYYDSGKIYKKTLYDSGLKKKN